jgi:3-oxoacyl-[acyl-carrier-protein] synthase II
VLFPFPKTSSGPRRVVVTGTGIVTALGIGWRKNADGFRGGKRAFRPVTLFDVTRQRTHEAAEVDLPEQFPQTNLTRKQLQRQDRATLQLLLAASEAWNQSGWPPAENLPFVLGTTSGGMPLGENYFKHAQNSPSTQRGQATRLTNYQAQRQAVDVMSALGFTGPLTIIANACASGGNAIGHGFEQIRHGRAEQVLAGGYDGLSQLVFAGFDSLQALSTTGCRPFSADRDGLGLGEGAGVLAMESLESAGRRGATILGEVVGYGAATDDHHLTQPHPEGNAALLSMTEACRVAQLEPRQIDYLNAHGTGTPLNDGAEAAAINRWAGDRAAQIRVSSTKGSVGHVLGGAGAIEAVISLMTLNGQWLPPSTTTETVDPTCQFDYVTQPRDAQIEHVLSNSFGFGGANATLVFRRWQ